NIKKACFNEAGFFLCAVLYELTGKFILICQI
ncbi:MAG: hypothetical protein ACI8X3_003464, partial [Saprospiraceae bacterium]